MNYSDFLVNISASSPMNTRSCREYAQNLAEHSCYSDMASVYIYNILSLLLIWLFIKYKKGYDPSLSVFVLTWMNILIMLYSLFR